MSARTRSCDRGAGDCRRESRAGRRARAGSADAGAPARTAPRGGQRPGGPGAATPADQLQVQRLLDAWALVQAKDQLQLTDEQYPGFVARTDQAARHPAADRAWSGGS